MSRKSIVEEIHKVPIRRFARRKVVLKAIDDLWQIDLVEMIPYANVNNNFKYLLTVIDCFSKYVWVKPILRKTSELVTEAMNEIFEESERSPKNLQSDNGKEFYNIQFKRLMKKYNINHYSTYTHLKASIVERFNRTLKAKMWKMFSMQGTYKWVDKLQSLVTEYNKTSHRTIKMAPIEVNKQNENSLVTTVFKRAAKLVKNKFKIGDNVRISKYKTIFEKGFTPNWTTEIFKITNVNNKFPVTYFLKDYKNLPIAGRFYEKELQKTKHPDVYLVEKILRRKQDSVLVKWVGFDQTHNSWVPKADVI